MPWSGLVTLFLVVVGSVFAFFSSPLAVALQCVFIALIIPDDQWSKQFRNVCMCVSQEVPKTGSFLCNNRPFWKNSHLTWENGCVTEGVTHDRSIVSTDTLDVSFACGRESRKSSFLRQDPACCWGSVCSLISSVRSLSCALLFHYLAALTTQ